MGSRFVASPVRLSHDSVPHTLRCTNRAPTDAAAAVAFYLMSAVSLKSL